MTRVTREQKVLLDAYIMHKGQDPCVNCDPIECPNICDAWCKWSNEQQEYRDRIDETLKSFDSNDDIWDYIYYGGIRARLASRICKLTTNVNDVNKKLSNIELEVVE